MYVFNICYGAVDLFVVLTISMIALADAKED